MRFEGSIGRKTWSAPKAVTISPDGLPTYARKPYDLNSRSVLSDCVKPYSRIAKETMQNSNLLPAHSTVTISLQGIRKKSAKRTPQKAVKCQSCMNMCKTQYHIGPKMQK